MRLVILKGFKSNGSSKVIMSRPISDRYIFNFERNKFIREFGELYDRFETDIIDSKELEVVSK